MLVSVNHRHVTYLCDRPLPVPTSLEQLTVRSELSAGAGKHSPLRSTALP